MKAVSTLRCSLGVPHPSTNRAFHCLTSEFEWDPVYSAEYGRQQITEPHSLSYDILTQQEVVYSRGLRVIHWLLSRVMMHSRYCEWGEQWVSNGLSWEQRRSLLFGFLVHIVYVIVIWLTLHVAFIFQRKQATPMLEYTSQRCALRIVLKNINPTP